MVKKSFVYTFFGTTIVLFLLDQITKYFVRSLTEPITVIPNFFQISYATNTGISFGMLQAYPLIPTIISFVVIVGVLYYYREIPQQALPQYATAGILAGALGNLMDRVFFGAVTDFIAFSFWPSFNLADSGITVGAIALMYYFWKEG